MPIGIGTPIPYLANLPGQTGESISLTISYPSSAFCDTASDPSPTVSGNVGAGIFSAGAGLEFLDTGNNTGSSTGVVDINNTVTGTYTITYTDTNSAVATTPLEVVLSDNATFSYSLSSFPQDGSNPTPTTVLAGGAFTAVPSGLVFVDTTTGEINLSGSAIGSYTITYNTSPVGSICPSTSTQPIAIGSGISQIDNVYSMDFDRLTLDQVVLREVGQASEAMITGSGSVSLWFKTSSNYGTSTIGNLTGGSGLFQYLCIRSNKLVNFVLGGGFGYIELTTVAVNDGNWHHLVLSYDSTTAGGPQRGTFKAYFDGQLTKTLDMDGSTESWGTSTLTTIGAYGLNNVSRYFDGLIDEVAAWDVVLTEAEALSIYNATEVVGGVNKTANLNTLTTPPLKWYRMGD